MKIFALCSDGMHNKTRHEINIIHFWSGKTASHPPTQQNIEKFIRQVPKDEKLCIYTDTSEGELHSAHVPLYTNGAKGVDAIINSAGDILWTKYAGSIYQIDIKQYNF
jgi:hypothetical protein